MGLRDAKKKFREFHMKEPREILEAIGDFPRHYYPIGYGVQISYRSDKWNDDGRWVDYIHWWEHETLVCVPEEMLDNYDLGIELGDLENKVFDVGSNRNEVTVLGKAIDINVAPDDRSFIELSDSDPYYSNNIKDSAEHDKVEGSTMITFDPKVESKDFVVCSPNGAIVYIISEQEGVFAFINNYLKVTRHGIEG